MITFSRGPCPTVWMDSLGIIPFAQALHITTSTEASGRPNSLQRMSLPCKEKSKRHLYMLNICGHFIQSSQKSKHHTEFKNCSEPLFSHMGTKSQISQMTYSWSHIFGKTDSRILVLSLGSFASNIMVPKDHQSYHHPHKKPCFYNIFCIQLFLRELNLKTQPILQQKYGTFNYISKVTCSD